MARGQNQEEFESNLSSFIPLMIQNPLAAVECPHCEGRFTVDGKRWRAPLMSSIKPTMEIRGRCCPYCMKVSLVPAEFFPKKVRASRAATK